MTEQKSQVTAAIDNKKSLSEIIPILLKYIVPFLVFVIAFIISLSLSYKYFYTIDLVGDDAREYINYVELGFGGYIFNSPRPFTSFFMALGFAMFGHYAPNLMIYACLFCAGMITSIYYVVKKITGSILISLFVIVLSMFSRLNWYYYATFFGLMESSALTCMVFSIYFAVQFYREDKKIKPFILMCLFYLFSMLFHERYMFCFVPIAIVSLIGWKTWKKRLIFSLVSIALFGFFLIYRLCIANSTPFVVTGKTKISLDIGILLSNFFKSFVNMFVLNENTPWLSGLTNQSLDGGGMALFVIVAIFFFAVFVLGITLAIYFAIKKKYSYLSIGLLLGIYCAIMLAAGSVSPKRVEPRWTYSGQVPLFIFFGLTVQMVVDFYNQKKEATDAKKNNNWVIKAIAIAGMIVPLCPFIILSSYTQNHKQEYYISTDILRADRYREEMYYPMLKEGKSKLFVICDKENYKYLEYSTHQWEGVKESTIILHKDFNRTVINQNDTFVCIYNGDEMSKPASPTLADPILKDYWIDGLAHSFYAYGTIDELYIKLSQTHFEGMPNNKVTVYNGDEVVINKRVVDDDLELFIPLEKDVLNQITIEAEYTYCPYEHGGTDIRNLSLNIKQLGGLGEPISPTLADPILKDYWIEGKSYSFYVNGVIDELYLKLLQTHFEGMPNNKITIYNGNNIVIDKRVVDSDLELFIPLKKNSINRITIEADYTYCPYEHGGSDTRNLSLNIKQIGGLGEPISPTLEDPILEDYWIDGKSYSFYAYGTIEELYLKLLKTNFDGMPNNKVTIYNGNKVVANKLEIDDDLEIFIPLEKDVLNRITIEAEYTYCPYEHGGTDIRNLSLNIKQLGGLGKPISPTLADPILKDYWIDGKSYSFYVNGTIDELYIKLLKTNFTDMPDNKITVYNGNEVVINERVISDNLELFIPLKKNSINRITIEADYTYCPYEHGGTDIRNLSLHIDQLGGLGEPTTPSLTDPILENYWVDGKSYSFYVYGTIDELYIKLSQTHFEGMSNNKVTIYNGNKVIVENLELDEDKEILIPLEKDAINRITIEAEYTYCPYEHGGSDMRNLSLYILQLGGMPN